MNRERESLRHKDIVIRDDIKDFILNHKVNGEEMRHLQLSAVSSLSLRVRHELEVQPESEQVIFEHFPKAIYYSSKLLGLRVPDKIDFVEGQKGVPNIHIENGAYRSAESVVDRRVNLPNGQINISPHYLKTQIVDLMEYNQKTEALTQLAIERLAQVGSHEVRHIKQSHTDPDQLNIDVDVLENQGLNAWSKTISEREAVEFERVFGRAYMEAIVSNPLI